MLGEVGISIPSFAALGSAAETVADFAQPIISLCRVFTGQSEG